MFCFQAQRPASPYNGSLPSCSTQPAATALSGPTNRKLLFPESQTLPASHKPPYSAAVNVLGNHSTASGGQAHMQSPMQQPLLIGLDQGGQMLAAPTDLTAQPQGQKVPTVQVPGTTAWQAAGITSGRLPQTPLWQPAAGVQTESLIALHRAAGKHPSWAQATLDNQAGSPHHHGLLASAVMLETLGRQKQASLMPEAGRHGPLQKREDSPRQESYLGGVASQDAASPQSPTRQKCAFLSIVRCLLLHPT